MIGQPITQNLKSLLHRLLTTQDLIDISTEANVSYSTVRAIYYRTQTITNDNLIAVEKMIQKAFEKSNESINFFIDAKKQLKQHIESGGGF